MARPGYNEDNTLNTSVFSPQNNGNTGREQYIADERFQSTVVDPLVKKSQDQIRSYEGTGITPQVFPDWVTKNPNAFDMMNNYKIPGKGSYMGSPMFLDAGITNRNLGGAKVMNATNYLDPAADDYFLREFGQYMKRYMPGYDKESDYYRQKQYRDSILDEEEILGPPGSEALGPPGEEQMPQDGYYPDKILRDTFPNSYSGLGLQPDPDALQDMQLNDYLNSLTPEDLGGGIETLEAGMGDSYQSLQQQMNDLDPDSSNYDDMLEMLNNDMEMKYPYMMAELTDDQMNMMGNKYNTPGLGGVSKEDLYNRTKDMEDTGVFGFGAQEPTTREEFEDYYRKLQLGDVGNWVT